MSKVLEWLFLWRRHTNDQQARKKIFNTFSYVEMQTKIMGYHSTPTTMATIKKTIARVGKSNWSPHTQMVPVCAPLMHRTPPFSFLSTLFSVNLFFFLFFFFFLKFSCLFKKIFYLPSERGEGREKKLERNVNVRKKHQSAASHTCSDRDWTHNPGMPHGELNRRLLLCRTMPNQVNHCFNQMKHWSGQTSSFLNLFCFLSWFLWGGQWSGEQEPLHWWAFDIKKRIKCACIENIMLSGRSQAQKAACCMIPFV